MSNKDIIKSLKGFVVYEVKGESDLMDLLKADNFNLRKYRVAEENELSTIGFLPTVALEFNEEDGEVVREEEFVSDFADMQVISIGSSKRKVPGSEVKKLVNSKIKAFVEDAKSRGEDVKVDKDIKEIFKEEAIKELLPKCFVEEYQTYAFHDKSSGLFFVFVNSFKKAEQINGLIRSVLGTFPVVPLSSPDVDVGKKLSDFITVPLNDKLTLEDFAEIENEEGVVTFKKESLYNTEIAAELLKESCDACVSKIGLNYDGVLSFIVTRDFVFSALKFESYLTASGHDFKSTFLLAANEVKNTVKELLQELVKE